MRWSAAPAHRSEAAARVHAGTRIGQSHGSPRAAPDWPTGVQSGPTREPPRCGALASRWLRMVAADGRCGGARARLARLLMCGAATRREAPMWQHFLASHEQKTRSVHRPLELHRSPLLRIRVPNMRMPCRVGWVARGAQRRGERGRGAEVRRGGLGGENRESSNLSWGIEKNANSENTADDRTTYSKMVC